MISPGSGCHFRPELGEVTGWSGARSVSWYPAEASQELWPGYGPGKVPHTVQSVHEHCAGSRDGTVQCLADMYPKQPYRCSKGYKRWIVTLMSKADCSYVNFVCSFISMYVYIIFIGKFMHILQCLYTAWLRKSFQQYHCSALNVFRMEVFSYRNMEKSHLSKFGKCDGYPKTSMCVLAKKLSYQNAVEESTFLLCKLHLPGYIPYVLCAVYQWKELPLWFQKVERKVSYF